MTVRVSRIISNDTLNRGIQIESAGNPRAKASTSTARGLGQFLNGTWLEELKQHRPDLFNGPPYDDELALEKDPSLQVEIMARFWEDNAKDLGSGWKDGDLYLAHFAGIGTAKKLLRAPPDDSVDRYFSAAAIKANRSILTAKGGNGYKTVGQVRAWADNSMRSRWEKAGRPDWIAQYWKGSPSTSVNDDAEDVEVFRPGPEKMPKGKPATGDMRGDPDLWNVQRRLKAMNYNPGGLDGLWGGMTAGALASFINDRKLELSAPTSSRLFSEVADDIKQAIADAESDGWVRPVSRERAEADSDKVDKTAPEAVPVRQNWFIALWGSVITFIGGIWSSISEYVSSAWQFFNGDDVPDEARTSVFNFVKDIPAAVWFLIATVVLGWIAWNSFRARARITESVQTGERA